jgi:glycosyltransferase involved in cell wall biosynthesis
MDDLKLSLITVNLNNAVGLEKTIESVCTQKYKGFEHIIIDGGSTDNSVNIIHKYSDNISSWISEPDKGIYNAMNKGISRAKGKYCFFLNSGDCLHNDDVLKDVFDLVPDEDLVYGSIVYSSENREFVSELPDPENLSFRHFIKSTLPHPATFIKHSLFDKLGYFNECNIICSDYEFFLIAIFKYGATLKRIPKIITVFDMNGISSKVENAPTVKKERNEILLKHFPGFLPDYIYLEELEYKTQHSFWVFIAKLLKSIKKK